MNHRARTRLAATISALAITAVACGAAVSTSPSTDQSDRVGTTTPADGDAATPRGTPAPDVAFTYWDGSAGTLADFAGTPVVLNFWASWCPACVTEMPDFERVHAARGDEVAFLGIATSDVHEPADELASELGITYALAEDEDGDAFLAFEGFAMPTTVFINAQGEVVHRHNGVLFEAELNDKIDEFLLAG